MTAPRPPLSWGHQPPIVGRAGRPGPRPRGLAKAVAAAGLFAFATTLAATYNPDNYVYLRSLAHPVAGGFVLAGCGLYTLYLSAPDRRRRLVAGWLGAVVGLLALLAACASAEFSGFGLHRSVVAESARYQLVQFDYGFFGVDYTFRVVAKHGLLTREGTQDVACFVDPDYHTQDSWRFASAEFTGPNEITFTTDDGSPLLVRFDPGSLGPLDYLDRCTDPPAGDP
jgi:hypothetical protein